MSAWKTIVEECSYNRVVAWCACEAKDGGGRGYGDGSE